MRPDAVNALHLPRVVSLPGNGHLILSVAQAQSADISLDSLTTCIPTIS